MLLKNQDWKTQGDHSPGKPGKVRELSGQGKFRENGKSQGKRKSQGK